MAFTPQIRYNDQRKDEVRHPADWDDVIDVAELIRTMFTIDVRRTSKWLHQLFGTIFLLPPESSE